MHEKCDIFDEYCSTLCEWQKVDNHKALMYYVRYSLHSLQNNIFIFFFSAEIALTISMN